MVVFSVYVISTEVFASDSNFYACFFPTPNMLSVIPVSTCLFASTSIPVLLKWLPCCSRYTTHIELSLAACIIKGHISNIYWVYAVWPISTTFQSLFDVFLAMRRRQEPPIPLVTSHSLWWLVWPLISILAYGVPCNVTIVYTPGSVQCLNNKCVFVNKLLGEFGNQYP